MNRFSISQHPHIMPTTMDYTTCNHTVLSVVCDNLMIWNRQGQKYEALYVVHAWTFLLAFKNRQIKFLSRYHNNTLLILHCLNNIHFSLIFIFIYYSTQFQAFSKSQSYWKPSWNNKPQIPDDNFSWIFVGCYNCLNWIKLI